jgi:hypothetical protein
VAGILIRIFLALLVAPAWAQTGPRVGPLLRQSDLGDLNNPATARGNLGVAYGAGAGTVAQGNDNRIVGAWPSASFPTANLLGGTGGGVAGITAGGGLSLSGNVLSALVTSVAGRTGAIDLTSGNVTGALGYTPLSPAGNLAGLGSAATARTNLGLGTAATLGVGGSLTNTGTAIDLTSGNVAAALGYTPLSPAGNLAGLGSAATARTNLGLGTAATLGVGGSLTNTGTAIDLTSGNVAAALGYTPLSPAGNLGGLGSAATARTNLGLGTLATQNANAVQATGGTIDGTVIGGSVSATGTFTGLNIPGERIDLATISTLVMDLQSYNLPLTYTAAGTSLTIGNRTTATVQVTTIAGSNAILITGSQPLSMATYANHPITVTLGGTTWNAGTLLGVINSGGNQTLYTSAAGAPLTYSGSGQTLTAGVFLNIADTGKTVNFGYGGPGGGNFIGTISVASNGTNVVTLSAAPGFANMADLNSGIPRFQYINIGTDNYTALGTALNIFLTTIPEWNFATQGVPTLVLNAGMLVTKLPLLIDRFPLRGNGRLTDASGQIDTSPISYVSHPVVPFDAPPYAVTSRGTEPSVAWAKLATVANPVCAVVGASTGTPDPGIAGHQTAWQAPLRQKIEAANPTRKFTWLDLTVGGGNFGAYVGRFTRPTGAYWDTNSATPWVGNPTNGGFAYNGGATNCVIIEWSQNDVPQVTTLDDLAHLWATLQTWPTPPAVAFVLDMNNGLNVANYGSYWDDSAIRFLEGFCLVRGCEVYNMTREKRKARDGIDPGFDMMKRVFNHAPNASVGSYFPTGLAVKGFHQSFKWASTMSAGWTAVGNIATFPLGGCNDAVCDYSQNFMIQYRQAGDVMPGSVSDHLYVRADLDANQPGAALVGGTVPRVEGGYAVTAGTNSISYVPVWSGPASVFTAADNGQIFTLPNCGSTSSSTATAANVRSSPALVGRTNTGPCVFYAGYVDATHVNMFSDAGLTTPLNAVTTVSAGAPQFILKGSPWVDTGFVGMSTITGAQAVLDVWTMNNEVGLQLNGNGGLLFRASAIRPNLTTALNFTFNGANALMTTSLPNNQGSADTLISTNPLNSVWYRDDAGIGPIIGDGSIGPFGGGGHPSSYMALLWEKVFAAHSFAIPAPAVLTGTTGSLGGGALAAGACATGAVTIAGASTGMRVGVTPAVDPGGSFIVRGSITSPNTVTVNVCAAIAGTPTATTYAVGVGP